MMHEYINDISYYVQEKLGKRETSLLMWRHSSRWRSDVPVGSSSEQGNVNFSKD